ncbi:GNAT family N-acetyltransferase [Pseudomonas turukhanskensis]|uniref:Acetyltransferase n=1 Tax=Pseudomonas turukhanskensis TaxID=1806536 RepID=A0A9W6K2T3_9PSED|nr:GNAT family N-acetyltransferase [Pseudomonas turukhanskensis]GLK88500.1 acetyltransferase [Pseudomonas turukhanskensis]
MPTTHTSLTDLSALNQGAIGEHWIEALKDGSHVLIRALQEQDREREFSFIKRLSAESRRARFSSSFNEPPLPLMEQLMNVQYPLQMAYVALVHDNGELREIGVARYAKTEDQCCEFAVVVADDWQQKGLGRLLMVHLMDAARRNGFTRMAATDEATNYHLHRLVKKLGFDSHYPSGEFSEIVHQCQL